MDIDKDNANPTILNASDLPTRRRVNESSSRDDGGSGLFDGLVPSYPYLADPFDAPSSPTSSEEESPEAIDEQEIYGTYTSSPHYVCP